MPEEVEGFHKIVFDDPSFDKEIVIFIRQETFDSEYEGTKVEDKETVLKDAWKGESTKLLNQRKVEYILNFSWFNI
ncbi:unnamed protein product [marine sediment metagenome]|uniref:Uncharacterized protein n=1 Tax=marine sediment metagenome TaxID=412755 RepID=X1BYH3_9ZZZZ